MLLKTNQIYRQYIFAYIVLAIVSVKYSLGYDIPEPRFEFLKPKGFRVSIPDDVGISRVTFSTTLLRPRGLDPPNRNDIMLKSSPKRWTYENKEIELKPLQQFRYSLFVWHDKKLHEILNRINQVPCGFTSTTVKGRRVCQGQMIFEDNFNNLNTSIWLREVRIPLDDDDADFVIFGNRNENLEIKDGKLIIVPKKIDEIPGYDVGKIRKGEIDLGAECTGHIDFERECKRQAGRSKILPPLFSASINTRDTFSFRYGKIEVRAKLPKGDWLFPLITLEPLLRDYGIPAHRSGQMRVAFIRGNENLKTKDGMAIDGSNLFGGVVLGVDAEKRDIWLGRIRGKEHWGNTFHTYSLTWRETSISLACDGRVYASICTKFNRNLKSSTAPFDKEFYIMLALSAGGISDFPDNSIANDYTKPWQNLHPKNELMFWNEREKWYRTWSATNSRLEIDYVKIWAL